MQKQAKMLGLIVRYWQLGSQAIRNGAHLVHIRQLDAVRALVRMKLTVPNEQLEEFDAMELALEQAISQTEGRDA